MQRRQADSEDVHGKAGSSGFAKGKMNRNRGMGRTTVSNRDGTDGLNSHEVPLPAHEMRQEARPNGAFVR